MFSSKWIQFTRVYWPTLVLVITPIALLPLLRLPYNDSDQCLYVLLLMAVYWATEAIPLAITSTIPVVLFPLMGILSTTDTCKHYMSEAAMMFLGGLMIAMALEQSELHIRVALIIIGKIGCSPRKLTLGLFFCNSFISMWISNMAAVAIMIPIIMGVLQELESQGLCRMYEKIEPPFHGQRKLLVHDRYTPSKTTLCYFLGCAFSSGIGGCGTIIGSGASIILKGVYEKSFPTAPDLKFNSWLFLNFPLVVGGTVLTWVYLQWLYMGMFRPDSVEAQANRKVIEIEHVAKEVIQKKLREQGKMNAHQLSVAILFVVAIIAYLTREPGFIKGWGALFKNGTVRDTTSSLLIVVLLFVLPRNYDFLTFFTVPANKLPTRPSQALLTWQFVHNRMEWGVLFLIGGGFALSAGFNVSGLNHRIGNYFTSFIHLPPFSMIAVVTTIVQLSTEVMANMTIASIVLPVFAEMAVVAKIHPLYLMIPVCMACNYSFLLPVSTPPNAIVASIVRIPTREMVKAGLGPTIICLLLLWALFPTWGVVIYPELTTFPSWASRNETNHQ